MCALLEHAYSTKKRFLRQNNYVINIIVLASASIMLMTLLSPNLLCAGLTSEERGELARKFKYYHESVRPTERFNLVQNANGTYFALNAELELLQTRSDLEDDKRFHVDIQLIVHYNDDRLFVRELPDILHIPDEFRAWTPTIELSDGFSGVAGTIVTSVGGSGDISPSTSTTTFSVQKSTFLDPKTGQITVFYRISGSVSCFADAWKYPFERFVCQIEFLTEQDERLFLRVVRDLRRDAQRRRVVYALEEWPNLAISFKFSREWLFAVVDVYLPSLLIFSVALFAQWKRRKVQVLVTIGSILCIVLIKNAQDESLLRRMGSRLYRNHYQVYGSVTLQDVWLIGLLVHLICILTVDLLLPSRRIIFFTDNASAATQQSLEGSPTNSESRKPLLSSPKKKRQRTAMPYISGRQQFYAATKITTTPTTRASSTVLRSPYFDEIKLQQIPYNTNQQQQQKLIHDLRRQRLDSQLQLQEQRRLAHKVGRKTHTEWYDERPIQRYASARLNDKAAPMITPNEALNEKQVRFQSSPYLFPLNSSSPLYFSNYDATPPVVVTRDAILREEAALSQQNAFNNDQPHVGAQVDENGVWRVFETRSVSSEDPIYIDATEYGSSGKSKQKTRNGVVNASYLDSKADLQNELNASYGSELNNAFPQRCSPTSKAHIHQTLVQPFYSDATTLATVAHQNSITVRGVTTTRVSPTTHYRHVIVESCMPQQQQQRKQRQNLQQQQIEKELSPYVVMRRNNGQLINNDNRRQQIIGSYTQPQSIAQQQQCLNLQEYNLHNNLGDNFSSILQPANELLSKRYDQFASSAMNLSQIHVGSPNAKTNARRFREEKAKLQSANNDNVNYAPIRDSRMCYRGLALPYAASIPAALHTAGKYDDENANDSMNIRRNAASSSRLRADYEPSRYGSEQQIYQPNFADFFVHRTVDLTNANVRNGKRARTNSNDDKNANHEVEEDEVSASAIISRKQKYAHNIGDGRRVARVTMGHKKQAALYSIFACFVSFVVGYVALIAYAILV